MCTNMNNTKEYENCGTQFVTFLHQMIKTQYKDYLVKERSSSKDH